MIKETVTLSKNDFLLLLNSLSLPNIKVSELKQIADSAFNRPESSVQKEVETYLKVLRSNKLHTFESFVEFISYL